eukprot:61601-Prorocentrum_minimum.AAC.4
MLFWSSNWLPPELVILHRQTGPPQKGPIRSAPRRHATSQPAAAKHPRRADQREGFGGASRGRPRGGALQSALRERARRGLRGLP